jgi:hypothetical protein
MRSDAQRCAAMHLLWYASRRVVYAGEWLDAAETVLSSIIGWRITCSSQTDRQTDGRTEGGSGLLTSKTRRKSICEFILTGGSTGQHRAAQGRLKARPGRGRAEVGIGEMGRWADGRK